MVLFLNAADKDIKRLADERRSDGRRLMCPDFKSCGADFRFESDFQRSCFPPPCFHFIHHSCGVLGDGVGKGGLYFLLHACRWMEEDGGADES